VAAKGLTVDDRLLIKALQNEKGWAVVRMSVGFLSILESGLSTNSVYITNLP